MTWKEQKIAAQELIMEQLSDIGYGSDYERFVKEAAGGDEKEADMIIKTQMDRIAKMFGYDEAWFC